MKQIIKLFVLFELGFCLASLAYAIHGIFWLSLVSLMRAIFCFLVANYLFPSLIRSLNAQRSTSNRPN